MKTARLKSVKTWDELVSAGRAAKDSYQWELGDLASEVETGYGEQSLAKYAVEIEVNPDTLVQYRVVSRAFPQNLDRSRNPWTVYAVLASQDDRAELVKVKMTVPTARDLVTSRRPVPPMPPVPAPRPAEPQPRPPVQPRPPEPELEHEPDIIVPRDPGHPPSLIEDPWLYVVIALREAVKVGIAPDRQEYREELTGLCQKAIAILK